MFQLGGDVGVLAFNVRGETIGRSTMLRSTSLTLAAGGQGRQCQTFIEDGAQAINVAARVAAETLAEDLFGRHVQRRSLTWLGRLAARGAVDQFGQSPVDQGGGFARAD